MKFRNLKESEIQCRVQIVKEKGFSILLYKDARCDMQILDETVGPMNWKREHTRENRNCIVSIWDSNKEQWVSKEDTGVESYTDSEKGLASDSFKRACFNWGIGRELYTAPFIWITAKNKETYQKDGRWKVSYNLNLSVAEIDIEDGVIKHIVIVDQNDQIRFTTKQIKKPVLTDSHKKWADCVHAVASGKYDINDIRGKYTVNDEYAKKLELEAMEVNHDA